MNKPMASPVKRVQSGQRAPPLTEVKRAAPKHHHSVRTTATDSLADDARPPSGLFGATELAINDIEMDSERLADSVETLPELEREIGIADWIDPQTGEPAEGQSPPHLENE